MRRSSRLIAVALCAALALTATAQQPPPSPPPPQGAAAPAASGKSFSQGELDQLLAPIALYPDALLAQVLMASTYPLEVVEAARWVKANSTLKDKALEDALQQQRWDAAVKSLAVFPQVLRDDEREARLDAEARRRVPRAAEGRPRHGAGAAPEGPGAGRAQGLRAAEGRDDAGEQHDRHQDRAHQPRGRVRADVQPDGRVRRVAVPRLPALLLLPARLRGRWGAARLHRRRDRRRRAVGQLQLGPRRRQREREPLQQLQPHEHQQRQLEPQRQPSRCRAVSRPGRGAAVRPRARTPMPRRASNFADAPRRDKAPSSAAKSRATPATAARAQPPATCKAAAAAISAARAATAAATTAVRAGNRRRRATTAVAARRRSTRATRRRRATTATAARRA